MEPKDRLKQIRNGTGMTQKAFALSFNIPISTYEQWEMGMRIPPVYVVDMIETITHYGCPIIDRKENGKYVM